MASQNGGTRPSGVRPMVENQDGFTQDQIETVYAVLEVMREQFNEDGMVGEENMVNDVHCLVQQYDEGSNWSEEDR